MKAVPTSNRDRAGRYARAVIIAAAALLPLSVVAQSPQAPRPTNWADEIINKEAEIIGVSDHLASELPSLLDFARTGAMDLSPIISRTIPLNATAVNETLDRLERYHDDLRVVITP